MTLSQLTGYIIVAFFSLVILYGGAVAKNEDGADKQHNPRDTAIDPQRTEPTTIRAKLIHRDLVVRPPLQIDDDAQAPVYPLQRTGIFFVNISIGQPPQPQLLVMDTGSSMTVVLQFGCVGCNDIEVPLYRPTDSISFKNDTCKSKYCVGIYVFCDTYFRCISDLTYGDGSHVRTVLTSDTFRFLTFDEGIVDVQEVAFGCTNNMSLNERLEGTNGILGLGPQLVSLAQRFNKFSYCIGSLNDRLSPYNVLILGDEAVTDMAYKTPLEYTAQYYITLEAISVGDKRFDIVPEGVTAIMDTGATMTRLTKDAFNFLIKEIKNALSGVLEHLRDEPRLCYDGKLKRDFQNFPLVRLHFSFGADLVLEPANLFESNSGGMVCLAVIETDTNKLGNVALIGMLAQQNYNFGYDLLQKTLSITKIDCRDLML